MPSRSVKRTHELLFPIGGIHKGAPNPKQPPFTTPDCLNVRPRDVFLRRERGGVRPGLVKAFQEQIGGATGEPIRMLAEVSFVVQDGFNFFSDPWIDEFNTGLFSPVWTGASWIAGGQKPTISDETIIATNGLADQTSGLVRALLDFDTTKDYEVSLEIIPKSKQHHGTYQIFIRMDTNNPVVTTDGVLIALTMTDKRGSWSLAMTEYVAGTPTAYIGVDGSLAAVPVLRWGTTGSGNSQFDNPRGVHVNPFTGNVYVADAANSRVQVFDTIGGEVARFGTNGSGDGQFNQTSDIAFSPSGHVFVADKDNNRVQHFKSETDAIPFDFVSKFGTPGTGDGQFDEPWGIAIMSNNNSNKIVVVDGNNHRVQIWSAAEAWIKDFGSLGTGDGQFSNPRGVVLDSNDNIYVVDKSNDRIQVFDSSGTFLYKFGTLGSGDGNLDTPNFLDFFGEQYLYVTDNVNNRISRWIKKLDFSSEISVLSGSDTSYLSEISAANKFTISSGDTDNLIYQYNTSGTLDTKTASLGSGSGQLGSSVPLAQGRDSSDNLFVADHVNNRIVKFTSALVFDSNISLTFPTNVAGVVGTSFLAVDSSNNFWIGFLDVFLGVAPVKVYNSSGVFQFNVGTGIYGTSSGDFDDSVSNKSLVFDSSGNAYITDPGNNRVQKFNSSGAYQSQFDVSSGVPIGQFNSPFGIEIDSQGDIYVSASDAIHIFSKDGIYKYTAVASLSTLDGKIFRPTTIRFDSDGSLFSRDSTNSRVIDLGSSKFIFDLNTVTSGSRLGEFSNPFGIGIDSVNNIGYIADDNDRITRFDLSDALISLSGELRAVVSGENIKVFWRGFEMIDQNVTASTEKKIGLGMDCTVTDADSVCIIENISVKYFLTETPRRTQKLAVASANGEVWRESSFGIMEKVVSALSLNANAPIQAVEFNQKLYIADYGDDRTSGSIGEVTGGGTIFDDAGVLDWTALSISSDDDVLVLSDDVGSALKGVYPITNLTGRGTDLVTNGVFASDTGWTKGTGWAIAAGVATCDGSQGADSDLKQTPAVALVEGKKYEIIYDLDAFSAGVVTAVLGGTEGTDQVFGVDGTGTKTETIIAGSGTDIAIRGDLDFVGTIDDVIVKPIAVTIGVSPGGNSGAASHTWRIARAPKIYDPLLNTLALWLTDTGEGDTPIGDRLLALYRGRMSFVGNPALPQVWEHSRQDDPLDFDYSDTAADTARAILGQNSDFGIVGEPITAQVPFSDDYIIYAAANSLWVLRGDAAFSGQIDNISYKVGIISGNAYTFGPSGELIFLSRDGIYILQSVKGGIDNPVSISGEYLPNSLRDIDPGAFQVTMDYDMIEQGVHIYITPVLGGTQRYFWMDWENKRFFPVFLRTSHEIMETISLTAIGNTLSVLHGCRDGFIRKYSRSSSTDDGFHIPSYVVIGPFYMSDGELFISVLKEMIGTLGKASGDVVWRLYAGDTHQEILTNSVGGFGASVEGTFSTELNFAKRVDLRGTSFLIRIEGVPGELPWIFENILMVSRDSGRRRKLV